MTQLTLFDYSTLDSETRTIVQQRTTEIKRLVRRTIEDVVEIGRNLAEVRDKLKQDKGNGFEDWLNTEFDWSRRTAYQIINVYEQFGCANFAHTDIALSALYLLASPSVPEEIRTEALEAAKSVKLTHAMAKELIESHKREFAFGDRVEVTEGSHSGKQGIVLIVGKTSLRIELENRGAEDEQEVGVPKRSVLLVDTVEERKETSHPHWVNQFPEEVLNCDEFAENYRDWQILLAIPNGGIIGVSVVSPDQQKAWCGETESLNLDLYSDRAWHCQKAKQFIDQLCSNNSTSAQELGPDSPSPDSNLDNSGLPSLPNATTIAKASLNCDSPGQKSSEILKNSLGNSTTTYQSTSSPLPLPASPLASRENDSEPAMSETVSPASLESLNNSSLNTSASKTSLDSSIALISLDLNPELTLTGSSLKFMPVGTMRNGSVSQADTFAPLSDGKDCFWLESPGALSSTGAGRPPGQTKLEGQLQEIGLLESGEVLNPLFLEKAYALPLGWTELSELRPATQLLEEEGQPSETLSIPESQPLPSNESSTLTAYSPDKQISVHFSSESDEHYTPDVIIEAIFKVFREIDLDPCSNPKPPYNITAKKRFTKDDDGLSQKWIAKTVFMNPPYGRVIGDWVDKLATEYELGNVSQAIALLPARTDTQWFKRLAGNHVCFIEGRLTFINNTAPAPFPSAVFYLGASPRLFIEVFSNLGTIYKSI